MLYRVDYSMHCLECFECREHARQWTAILPK